MENKIDLNELNDSELLMLYKEEDELAKNLLYLKYKFIIDLLIKKHKAQINKLNVDYQEVYSECSVGFSDALHSYQEDKETSLSTFITLCIERRIYNIMRKYNREKYKGKLDVFSLDYVFDNGTSTLMDTLSDECENDPLRNMTETEDYNELVSNIKAKLTKFEYEVFILMTRGLSYQEIAKILNKEPKQIDNAIQRIKNKIKILINLIDK